MQIINHRQYTVSSLSELPKSGELFTEVIRRFNISGVRYAVGSGTALGLYRDQDLIPSDTDLDIMVLSGTDEYVENVKSIFTDYPLAVEVIEEGKVQQLAYYMDGVIIDIHFYRLSNGLYHCYHQAGELQFIPLATTIIGTKYGNVFIMSDIEYMLEEEYGPDWRIPQYRKKGLFQKYEMGLLFGVFDPIHYGHIRLIRNCYKRCNALHIVVRSDEHIRKYKDREPYFTQEQRAEDLERLVDTVHLDKGSYGFLSFHMWVEDLHPDVFFASVENVGKICLDVPVIYMPRTPGVSSSVLRKAIQ